MPCEGETAARPPVSCAPARHRSSRTPPDARDRRSRRAPGGGPRSGLRAPRHLRGRSRRATRSRPGSVGGGGRAARRARGLHPVERAATPAARRRAGPAVSPLSCESRPMTTQSDVSTTNPIRSPIGSQAFGNRRMERGTVVVVARNDSKPLGRSHRARHGTPRRSLLPRRSPCLRSRRGRRSPRRGGECPRSPGGGAGASRYRAATPSGSAKRWQSVIWTIVSDGTGRHALPGVDRGTRSRIAPGSTSNRAGVVPGCSPSSSTGTGSSVSTVTTRPRSASAFGWGRCVPR